MTQKANPEGVKASSRGNWEKMTLDVGCGATPKGDVNGDLFTDYTPHNVIITVDPKKIKNFVKLDAQCLPFKDKTFKQTVSFHCLEHLKRPWDALNEMRRVTKGEVIIRVPCWHFYVYVTDFITLFKCFFGIPFVKTTKHFFNSLRCCFVLSGKLNDIHLWYIYFSNADEIRTNKKYGVPYEHVFKFYPKE